MLYDYHAHSSISKDSEEALLQMVFAARNKDLLGICLTEHLDPYFPDDFEPFAIDWDEYRKRIKNAREVFPELEVFMGVEAGLNKNSNEEIDRQLKENPCDFVLGSMHCTNEMTVGLFDYYTRYEKDKIKRDYMECLVENIKAFDNFDCVAHIGFLSKFAPDNSFELNFEDKSVKDLIDELLKTVIAKGKGIELNTSGFKNSNEPLPTVSILKRYKELGGEILTLGSDAHEVKYVAYEFDRAKKIIKDCGFNYLAKFVARKPLFYEF